MVYKLIDEESKQPAPQQESFGRSAANFAEGMAHSGASAVSSATSSVLGAPGDVLGFINEVAARPFKEFLTGEDSVPYDQTHLGKMVPSSSRIKDAIQSALPYTKPRNDYEKKTNDVVETVAALMLPGSQAKVGRFLKTNPATRALFKAIGAETAKEGIKDWTGSEGKGDLAKAGTLMTLSFLDRPNASKYVGALYKEAEQVLEKSGNPAVAAGNLRSQLMKLRESLTRGTLAPSEQAVVNEIDASLAHFADNYIHVKDMWGITRSLNEKKQDVIRSAAGKQGRERARKLYDQVIHGFNKQLGEYGKANPAFGQPFKDAQEGFATLAKSNFITNWAEKNLNYNPSNKWLPHLFGGAVGGAIGTSASSLSPASLAAPAGYQIGKFLYRVQQSPTLRKYYMEALRGVAREDVALFNRSLEKMDRVIEKENNAKPPFRLLDDEE